MVDFGDIELSALIRSKPNITTLLSEVDGDIALVQDKVIPEDWPINTVSLNYYFMARNNFNYNDTTWAFSCRAGSYGASLELAKALYTEIHRVMNGSGYYVKMFETISPANEQDNYNTPVQINIKGR